jgi:MFS family permease
MGSKIWRIVGAAFVGMLGFGAVIPILPVYLHEQAGASTFVTGLLIGMSSAFALLGRLFAGKTADRKGRRTALLLGMCFCAVAGVLYLPVFGLWALSAGRVLHGLGEGFFVTAAVAWTVDLAPDNRRAQALGYLSSGIWGGVSVGPAIGQALGAMSSVALCLTVSSIAVFGIVYVMHEDPRPHDHTPSRWVPRPVLLPGVMLGLGNVTYAAMAGFLILLLHQRGHVATWAFSAFAVAVLFGRLVFGGLPDRMGPRRSLFAGYALLGLGLIAIIFSRSSFLDLPAALLIGLGYAFPWPALASVVVAQVSVSERAAALGALNAFYDLAVAASSAAAGAAAGHWGLTAPFWIALACVCIAITMLMTSSVAQRHPASNRSPEFWDAPPDEVLIAGAPRTEGRGEASRAAN